MSRFFILFFLICTVFGSSAQVDSSHQLKVTNVFIFGADKGNVVIHTNAVKNITGAMPFGFFLEASKQQINQTSYNNNTAYVRYGWQFAYYDFNTPILGNGTIINYYLQPVYRLTNRLQFSYRASFGAAYLSSPYNAISNIENKNYSSYIVPYMHIGASIGYRISSHIGIEFGTNFRHLSNGNITQPNKGINYTTTGFSLVYHPDNNVLPKYKVVKNKYWKGKKPILDIGLFFVPTQAYYNKWEFKRHYVLGLTAQVSKQVGRTNALLVGGEAYYNNITADAGTKFLNNKSALLGGLFTGHEFLLNRFIFSQNIGMYVTKHPSYNSDVYVRLGLRYKLSNHFHFGLNLKAHADEADFFDMRLMYRF